MRIIENRSLGVSSTAGKQSYASAVPKVPTGASSENMVNSAPIAKPALSQQALEIRASQTVLAETERALGTISRLAETISKNGPEPVLSPLQDSIRQAVASLQRAYPQYAQRLRDADLNPSLLSSELSNIKRELTTQMQGTRRTIAKTVIAEQNRNAVANQSYSPEEANKAIRSLDVDQANQLLARRPSRATELLQD
ncbi:MAG: hypothetical protein ACRCY4_09055 [Brevinema sp.]